MGSSIKQSARMHRFSTLAGPIQNLPKKKPYEVGFTSMQSEDGLVYRFWSIFVACGALGLVMVFAYVLFQPEHWIITQQPESPLYFASLVMLICLFALQLFVIIGSLSATRSTLKAKSPLPVRPPKNLRIALATSRASGEPVDMVRATLEAAKNVRYKQGTCDVWLLDETKDPTLKKLCAELGVFYFSRNGKSKWNTPKYSHSMIKAVFKTWLYLVSMGHTQKYVRMPKPNPYFASKSKHGNYNSWRQHLKNKKISYDILAGVDTDHVPIPKYLERLLGYFRDPDVAYVVGPQVYGNYGQGLGGLVSRWAESQASFFQSTIQRAGNASKSAMFVGTNYAVRMNVLDQINGFQPCITEDMATGLAIHSRKNPDTGKRWKSVYTPDVLAVGEGPDLWSSFFTQQWRWAAGTFDTWNKMVWRIFYKLSPGAMLHYFLMLTYYPITALTWLLSVVSSMIYLLTGATAILAPWSQFVTLFAMSVVMQFSLYFWNRRFNVSPHEPEGSYGVFGMVMSSVTAPIYLSAFIGIAFGKKAHFVVTTKGGSNKSDTLQAFSTHIKWLVLLAAGLIFGILNGHNHPAMLIWVSLLLVISALPVVLGFSVGLRRKSSKLVAALQRRASVRKEQYNA